MTNHRLPGAAADLDRRQDREDKFVTGLWLPGRVLNGDDSNRGRYLRLPAGEFTIRRIRLYRYR